MNLNKSIWITAIISIIIFGILVLIGDLNLVYDNLKNFSWQFLPLTLGLFSSSLLVRIFRWHYWFNLIEKNTSIKKSSFYYVSGLAFLLTPGRFGEAARSYYIKKDLGISKSKSMPLVLLERFFDLIGLILIILIGLFFVDYNKTILIFPIFFIVIIILVTQNKNLMKKLLNLPQKNKYLSKFAPNSEDSIQTISKIIHLKCFIPSSLLSLLIIFFDLMGAFMLIQGFNIDLNFIQSAIIISASVIVGALSLIPGGMGVVEGGMVGLMKLKGIAEYQSVSFSILYRITYSWFLTVIGLIFLRKVSRNSNPD